MYTVVPEQFEHRQVPLDVSAVVYEKTSSIVPAAKREQIFNSNLLPEDMEIYNNDNYDDFLEKRALLLLSAITNIAR